MTIDNWIISASKSGVAYVEGEVYNSTKYKDGTFIRTSAIKSISNNREHIIVVTRNSTYNLPFRLLFLEGEEE